MAAWYAAGPGSRREDACHEDHAPAGQPGHDRDHRARAWPGGSVLATASSVRPATGTASWPEFHGHAADTVNNPYETIIGTGNVASLK
jgi:hypothetical protein